MFHRRARAGQALLSSGRREEGLARAQRLRRPFLERLESRHLLTSISEFSLPSASAEPLAITAGPGGSLWFIEQSAHEIATFNPATGGMAAFPLPSSGSFSYGITSGPDGNIWFTEYSSGKIGMINPATHATSEFALPSGSFPYGIAAGPDGNIWFTNQGLNQIGMINPTTHAISLFSIPTTDAAPFRITAGPDGNLYFTEYDAGKVGMIDPTTHVISEFPVPTPDSEPDWITSGPDGNIYFTEYATDKIGVLDPATHAITEISVPTAAALPSGIATGTDGNIWFAEEGASRIGMLDPTTHAITELRTPSNSSEPFGIAAGPEGDVWFTEFYTGKIASVDLQIQPHWVVTQEPPASVNAGSPFGLSVTAEYEAGIVDSSLNGPLTVSLSSNPGGAVLGGNLTATASGGVATFSDLSLSQPAAGYTLVVTGGGAAPATTSALSVTGTTPLVLSGAQLVMPPAAQRAHVAKVVLHFSAALIPSRAANASNYAVFEYTRRGNTTIARRVGLRALYNRSTSTVTLNLQGGHRFVAGGEIVVNASPPYGIEDTAGTPLAGNGDGVAGVNAILAILPGAGGITL